jgi:hypothetical protein
VSGATGLRVDALDISQAALEPQELLHDYGALRVVFYEECIDEDRDGRVMGLVRLVACKGDAGF